MDKYLSQKISILSFICIILVLYIHSGFHDTPNEIQGMYINYYLQESISGQIGRLAVPLFFMISGYLFFYDCIKLETVYIKQKRRIRSLLLPYLVAGLFLPFFYILLGLVPGTDRFVNSFDTSWCEGNIIDILYHMYWDAGNGSPMGFHLWFLRDLIIIVLLSPFIYVMKKIDKKGCFVCLAIFICSLLWPVFCSSLFWFILGSYYLGKIVYNSSFVLLLLVLYVTLSTIELFYPSSIWIQIDLLLKIIGVIVVWNLYDLFIPQHFDLLNHFWLKIVTKYTFFVYLYHEPTINIVRKIVVLPFGRSSFGFAFSYLLSPLFFYILFILFGRFFSRSFPKIYSFCTGGR